jgi:hypothetical protein
MKIKPFWIISGRPSWGESTYIADFYLKNGVYRYRWTKDVRQAFRFPSKKNAEVAKEILALRKQQAKIGRHISALEFYKQIGIKI